MLAVYYARCQNRPIILKIMPAYSAEAYITPTHVQAHATILLTNTHHSPHS